ncbi:MAG: HAD-IC family P-type ATPase [Bdellovibrionaceae bacterium]|nr:HAD-IC family P-type ATPase [Pseudobdellovibrionaceae bacterium]MDW8190698.1 HAD-IC family P-type ATPase [Pseudobdellovibrionaceae bacterium]
MIQNNADRPRGLNRLPEGRSPSGFEIFLRQLHSPILYVLIFAAIIAYLLGNYSDGHLITIVILINSILGWYQELKAEKSLQALRSLTPLRCKLVRKGKVVEMLAEDLLPGDQVLLETGDKIPADGILINSIHLEVNESLLTGESTPVTKTPKDGENSLYAGTMVTKGRGIFEVTTIGMETQLGRIAEKLQEEDQVKPPLILRFERMNQKIAFFFVSFCAALGLYLFFVQNFSWHDVLIFTVALAVSAIPEGLPISITVALTIATYRMSKRNVIVRKLPAVESLGSCTFIASDKTGTLTVNQLTINRIVLLQNTQEIFVTGSGYQVDQNHFHLSNPSDSSQLDSACFALAPPLRNQLYHVVRAGFLCNEADLKITEQGFEGRGDAVDIAFLILYEKFKRDFISNTEDQPFSPSGNFRKVMLLPFESERAFAASIDQESHGHWLLTVKGALEKILPLCAPLNPSQQDWIEAKTNQLAQEGYRVLALAQKSLNEFPNSWESVLHNLELLGLVAMIDPLRPEAKQAIQLARQAGIQVAMITGDHPLTAFAIARDLNLAQRPDQVVSGKDWAAMDETQRKQVIKNASVFARITPVHKLEIVQSLIELGHFVAVTGDGANDAPALKKAHVGIAMGKSGTEIAKESADLIITDDRFISITHGIEEGRIAYSNIRKVVYLLISTGFAEILLFFLSALFQLPLPLSAAQILWLNLVTNGIQDKGLVFEHGEGHELHIPPRSPQEGIFNHLMIRNILVSGTTIGLVAFFYFYYLISIQKIPHHLASNLILLLMVFCENLMVFNAKSETKSIFQVGNWMKNKFLIFSVFGAQLVHIGALYLPFFQKVLKTNPVDLSQYALLLCLSSLVIITQEINKLIFSCRK